MKHSIPTTLVSCAAVIADCDLVVEFTDGSLKAYSLWAPMGGPATYAAFGTRSAEDVERRLCWLTPERVRDEVWYYNNECRQLAQVAHDLYQRQHLGEDYRQRGYR